MWWSRRARWSDRDDRIAAPAVAACRGDWPRAAFTILEILLAVALIGLLAAALVSAATGLVGDKPSGPTDIFWQAVQAARRSALEQNVDVTLSVDTKEKRFAVAGAGISQYFPLPEKRDLTVDFLPATSSRSSVLIGGALLETQTLPAVTFYADGTCTPFRLQIRSPGGNATVLSIDPWTCAPVLTPPDAGGR